MRWIVVLWMMGMSAAAEAAPPQVVASIKPLHSLVAAVMEGAGEPVLLVAGNASPHTFQLKPSQMEALQHAGIVFYIGDEFEVFLRRPLLALPQEVERVSVADAARLDLLPARGAHAHGGHHDESIYDLHVWLDPANAKKIVAVIAQRLSAINPEKKALYESNAAKVTRKLSALDHDLRAKTKPLRGKPYIVFHDAYQYFEQAYGLASAGSVTIFPDQPPGAKHLSELRERIRASGAACVFREPSFDGKLVDTLVRGTSAKKGVLDPEGALLDEGPELYFALMEKMADSLAECLRK